MPSGKLDAKTVEAAKPRAGKYRLSDGGGLLLEIVPSGAKVWLARVTVAGRRRDMGLGPWPAVTLAQARQKALAARREALGGADPVKARRAAAKALEAARKAEEEAERRIFSKVAEAVIKAEAPSWKNARTAHMWESSLELHAAPLMKLPVASITREMVRDCILPIWHEKPIIAAKTLRRIGAVLRYAAAQGWGADATAADVRTLRHLGFTKQAGERAHPSLAWRQAPAFFEALDKMPGLAPVALRFAALSALRSGEARALRWNWISFDGGQAVLTVPGLVMKGRKLSEPPPHRIPLSSAMLETLATAYSRAYGVKAAPADLPKLARIAGDSWIFPNASRTGPFSDVALLAVIRRMNEGKDGPKWVDPSGRPVVPHGWRATFRTWADDCHPGERDAAEKALAHEDANKVAGRYRRSDLFERRIGLMEAWGQHCTKPAAPVVSLPARAKAKGA
ncbi:MAG: integrase family protein [Roseomonas sp.]|nr:integrase family protein [Roseomonas sp.]MCA3381742.1 integrase family protein [Roseomonas sp.]